MQCNLSEVAFIFGRKIHIWSRYVVDYIIPQFTLDNFCRGYVFIHFQYSYSLFLLTDLPFIKMTTITIKKKSSKGKNFYISSGMDLK